MVNPVERLTAEWQLAPAAALSDLPYTGMAVMRWTCRTALKREFVSRVGDDVHVFSYVLRNSRATSWLDGRQVWTARSRHMVCASWRRRRSRVRGVGQGSGGLFPNDQ
jgi:hypothetical protein